MNPIRYALLIATVTLVLPASRAFGGINRWTTSGPFGVPLSSLAIDPTNPETVYAGTGGEVFKSRDGGVSWTTTSLEAPSGLGRFFSGLAIDPRSSSSIYAATNVGVFKSLDGGGSWAALGLTVPNPLAYSVALDPTTPSTVYAGTAQGLFKSTNGGSSWSGRLLAASIYSLLVTPQTPSTIIGADQDQVQGFYYYPTNSTLYKSTNAGATWSDNKTGFLISPGALAIDPTNASTLYAGNSLGGVYKSLDSGSTWRKVSTNSGAVYALVMDPRNPSTLYAASYPGVFRSTDGGVSWQAFGFGLPGNLRVVSLAIDRTGTRLYAGTSPFSSIGGGVYAYQIFSGALDLSVGTDNRARLLFVYPNNHAVFWSFDNAGNLTGGGGHGPYRGWHASAVADGSDGLTRVLWNNLDGSAALWLLGPSGNLASYLYRPAAAWKAVDVSVGRDDTTHILWTNIDGRTEITSVAVSGGEVSRATYGPYSGWVARSIANGADGLTRVLWTEHGGRVGLSLIDAGHIVATHRFTPAPGWTARDIAVATDNQTRILWGNADGRMVLWSVDNSGAVTDSETVYAASGPGQSATRISAGPDGLTRVLWTSPDGAGALWLMDLDNVRQSSTHFCGTFSLGCAAWDY